VAASRPADHRVVVVGAGIGGIVSALLLACRGLPVTLVDAAPQVGGKMRQLVVDGVGIDAGPTVFTMRWVFDAIAQAAGVRLEDLLKIEPLSVLARHAWRGQDATLDLHANLAHSAEAIARFSSPAEARRFLGFCAQAKQVYQTLEGPYIRSGRPTLGGLALDLGPRGLAVLAGLGPFANLWRSLGRHFHDARLQQLFGRYATYCGASPWQAPATLMLVAQVELDGVWSVQGGMQGLAQALAGLAERRGVRLELGTAVSEILLQGGRASGVRLADGRVLAAESVVFNGDTHALACGLLGAQARRAVKPTAPHQRSLSALTWALHARSSGFALERHNVFFDDDYRSEFDDIFQRGQLPRQGTVYVCAQDRGLAAAVAPGQAERLLCLVNAPPDGEAGGSAAPGRSSHPEETEPCEHRSFALLRACGLNLRWTPQQVQRTTPQAWAQRFPATGGALYGRATHGWMSSFSRPTAASRVPGLYLAGGSVHPGPGVPMAAMSGRLAAATLLAHLDSTSRSRRVHISGGISTPSVTTAPTA
jgi:1-hydroxycarotenoid 3,4-desaturase